MQKGIFHFGILRLYAAAARNDDDIDICFELVRIKSVYLSKSPADAVAHDCLAQLCGHGIANAARSMVIFQSIHDHVGRNGGFAFVIKPFKLIILFQS